MNFPIKYFFSKCDQIRGKLLIWSHLLKKSLMENFIFCAVQKGFQKLWQVVFGVQKVTVKTLSPVKIILRTLHIKDITET